MILPMDRERDTAQVCLNGHVINTRARDFPDHNEARCSRCGESTITSCPACKAPIRGGYPGIVSMHDDDERSLAKFCPGCGEPYPWTTRRLATVKETLAALKELNAAQRKAAMTSVRDLIVETPRTELATAQFGTLISRLGKASSELIRAVLVDVVADQVKRKL